MDSSSLADTGVIWTRSTYSPTVLTVLKNKYDFSPCFKDQSVYVYSSYSWLNFFWLRFFFFFKQHGITDCENFHFYLIATCSHSSNSSFIWLKERARQSWLIQHETSATWLILESNCPKQRLRLWLLKELFRPNTWPITKWPFITLTLPLESCQCLKSVQCHSALCLQSGHTQQHVHFAMTVFTSGIHKRSLPQALLTKREETSSDVQNIDWLTLSCYIRRYCTVCCLFVILQVLE